ncbi:MAG: IclR family transcriptional regulator [Bacillota bacterium]|nr:IclR family transcriptional regulator [Bacillota bacterium]
MSRPTQNDDIKTVQAVERALSLLEVLAKVGAPMTVTDLAEHTKLNISTVHRLLSTLIVRGFVEQEKTSSKYKLTMKMFEIGNAALYNTDIKTIARPFLEELVERCNETVNLAILDGSEVVYLDQIESTNMVIVKMFAKAGSRGPAHCTSTGKTLLAYLPDNLQDKLLAQLNLVQYTNETIVEIDKLKKELERVKQQGYAFDLGERDEGVRCVAAPVKNYEGEIVAAISASGPSSRITNYYLNNELVPLVLEIAGKISAKLGYNATKV